MKVDWEYHFYDGLPRSCDKYCGVSTLLHTAVYKYFYRCLTEAVNKADLNFNIFTHDR
jgi:hypothetical protein